MDKNFFQKNLTTILVVLATVILGGVAIFTAVRLFQLRNQPVAPNAPESAPQAANEGVILTIPLETVKRGPGQHLLATQDVSQYSGLVCVVTATAQNQGSVHPDNNLIVSSGSGNVIVPDVEREADGVFSANGTLTLGNTVSVTLDMGPDEVFSAGIDVSLDCQEPTPSPTPTATPPITTNSCTELAFSLSTATPTATPTSTPTNTPTATPTATPTSTPKETASPYQCNSKCTSDSQCQQTDSHYVCHDEAGQTTCRHKDYTSQANCQPPTSPSSTPTIRSTATPAALPEAGVETPTLLGIGAGIILLLGALVLAL